MQIHLGARAGLTIKIFAEHTLRRAQITTHTLTPAYHPGGGDEQHRGREHEQHRRREHEQRHGREHEQRQRQHGDEQRE